MKRHAKASSAGSNPGQGKRLSASRPQLFVFLCLALALVGALSASPALAEETHPYTGISFGPKGAGDNSTFQGVVGLAIDPANNDVYVYDGPAEKIYKFDSAGNPVDFPGPGDNAIEVGYGYPNETEIAVAPPGSPGGSAGDIYLAFYPNVQVYGSNGTHLGEISDGGFCGVAVNPSGHIFAASYPSTIEEYVPTADAPFAADKAGSSSSALSGSEFCNVAADGLGKVYAANPGSIGPPLGVLALDSLADASPTKLDPTGRTLAVDPASDDVYVNRGDSVVHYDSAGGELNAFGAGRLFESAAIAVNGASGRAYVSTGEGPSDAPDPRRVEVFGPLATVPDVKAEAVTAITPRKATLHGTVNPDGLAVTGCKFEYGTTASYGQTAPCEGAIPIPTDSNDHPVSASLSGLEPDTTYHVRLAATNANGTNLSADQTFKTANAALTGQAAPIGGVKATLNGVVFPEGEAVSECFFEYGTDTSYGKTASCEGSIPTDEGEHSVTAAITHLVPNGIESGRVYHFRLVINRLSGIVQGADQSFKTKETVITGAASAINPPTATIEGSVNPEGVALTECKFEYGITEAFESSVPCVESPAAIGEGNSPVSVHANLSGLPFEAFYLYRLIATNVDGSVKGKGATFKTPGVPLIQSEQATNITDTKAELVARINPKGLPTTYHLEYGLTSAYGQSTAEAAVGGDETVHVLTNAFEGLTPNTTYHWRAVAVNSHGTTEGSDRTFTTYLPFSPETNCPNQALRSGASANLPDCRAYELVSPAKKVGQVFPPEPNGYLGGSCKECQPGTIQQISPMQSTDDGEAIVYEGQPFSANLASGQNQYLARRSPSGWATQGLSSPLFNSGYGQAYKNFSADLTRSVIYQIEPVLSPEAPSREGKGFANLYLRGANGSLQPLITEEPPNRAPGAPGVNAFTLFYAGANSGTATAPALSHLIFEANDALTAASADAPAAPDPGTSFKEPNNLYEWAGGQLRLVNVVPGNAATIAEPALGGGFLRATVKNSPGSEGPNLDHAISADGSRIFWSDKATGQVYVRIDGKETKKIEDPGKFVTASADGAKVLLDDGCLYDLATEVCEEDLTQGQGGFEGILGAADDLSRIYFVDTAALTGGEENANEEEAEAGKFNLYAWHQGTTAFIGTLSFFDNRGAGQYGDWRAARVNRTAQVSPDGHYLAFRSIAALTGHDNHQAGDATSCSINNFLEPEEPCREVFEYDALAGSLSCASCNPAGQRPVGASNFSLLSTTVSPITSTSPVPQPNNLLPDGQGRLFFESQDQLTPRDTNGDVLDVYEWKPNGVAGCARSAGCVALISSGHSPQDSLFLNATPNGSDAFIVTREQLLGADRDDFTDLYDARVNGGISENTPPPCLGEACKGPSTSAPEQAGPGSSTFAGPGNEKPKKHKHKKKRRKHAHKHKSQERAAKHNSGGQK